MKEENIFSEWRMNVSDILLEFKFLHLPKMITTLNNWPEEELHWAHDFEEKLFHKQPRVSNQSIE
jgi:hypothetical protein